MIKCECTRASREHGAICGQPATMLVTREGADINLCPDCQLSGDVVRIKYGYFGDAHSRHGRDWIACIRAAGRLADMVCLMYHPTDAKARAVFPVATWSEIIAAELGIEIPGRD